MSKKSAAHYISALRNFFKWLHTCPSYQWQKPEGLHEIKTRVATLENERQTQVTSEQVFSLDELVLLYRYGKPLDRLLILLGLNCGFGAAEAASLLTGEVHLNVPPSSGDSYIKRIRRKNRVYGEFSLFGHTVQGIEWALEERRQHGKLDAKARLLLNGNGGPFDKPTKGGNPNRQIPNRFTRLRQRIADESNAIKKLPFKMLRKTGGDLVKRFSDGEIAGVYLCHGQPVATDNLSDAYTQRPFGKVFTALRHVEDYLAPMFEAVETDPFQP